MKNVNRNIAIAWLIVVLADQTAAVAAGLEKADVYRTGSILKIVL